MTGHVCQSCGMPLKDLDMQGTHKNGLHIEDYCVYCYKDGEFTEDVTMDEMIRLCSRYVEGNSRNVAVVGMKMLYPRLKRWARKEETQHEGYKSIIRVMEYIQAHLDENTNLQTLAGIARLSHFHFHRIFKLTIGESLAEYVLRLRMEYVAEQLQTSAQSLAELAVRTGYSSEQALSRAFKKYFTIPPRAFKTSFYNEAFGDELVPRICRNIEKYAIRLLEKQPKSNSWQRLYMYAMVNRLLSETTESMELINNGIYYPCISVQQLLSSNKHVETVILKEGIYAIFTHKGSTSDIPGLFEAISNYWIPKSKYNITKDTIPYIKFLNNPMMVEENALLIEIYVPVV